MRSEKNKKKVDNKIWEDRNGCPDADMATEKTKCNKRERIGNGPQLHSIKTLLAP